MADITQNKAEPAEPLKPRPVETDAEAGEDPGSEQVDIAQMEQTLFYQDVPVSGPAWAKDAAQSRASMTQRLAGTADWTIGNGVGSLAQMTPQELAAKNKEEAEEWADAMMEIGERQQKAEREQERQFTKAWLKSDHTYAGKTMSGDDWKAMMDWFDDPENAADWEDAMIARTGKSREEVQKIKGKVQRHMELIEKDASGTMTAAERTEFTKLDQDRDVRTSYDVIRDELQHTHGLPSQQVAVAQTSEQKSASVSEGSSLIAARAELNAEPITPVYNAAAQAPGDKAAKPAAGPKDGPALQTPAVQTPAVATPVKVAAMTANLDMG